MNDNVNGSAPRSEFERRLTIATLCVLLVFLAFHLLRELASLFQPLLIAALITYMAYPMHHWIVGWGVPSKLAHILLVSSVLICFFAVGRLAHSNVETMAEEWPVYEKKLDDLLATIGESVPMLEDKKVKDLVTMPTVEQMIEPARQVAGSFASFLASAFVVVLYLVFLGAEMFSFPDRAGRAFGPRRSEQVMEIVASINRAVGGYLAVMTLINFLMGFLTFVVLVAFDVPFAVMWGLFMFLFAFIPYIGSVVITLGTLLMSLIRHSDQPWLVLVIGLLLIAIQQGLGSFVQPRLMGNRLGVSPLLILLSLAFWGILWGIIGMLLAVPLLMVLKITLEHIPETKPIAVLMSNS